MNEERLIKERFQKAASFVNKNYNYFIYAFLAIVVFISVRIRTLNLPGLRDVTTGDWTLGPDLDPFLFLRWAKYIVQNGSLMAIDYMRYVPLGYNTKGELLLHPYMIALFHKVAVIFGSSSVEQSAAIYPVFFFAITVIAFFLFVRKVFLESVGAKKAGIIAVIASFFLSVIPAILPRTIAGIPEKESAAFFFLFMSLYLFVSAWNSKSTRSRYVFAILSGAFTAGMALVWGGFAYIFLILSGSLGLAFFLDKLGHDKAKIFITWIVTAFALMIPSSTRYSPSNLVTSVATAPGVIVLALLGVNYLVWHTKIKDYFQHQKLKIIPDRIITFIVTLILGTLVILVIKGPKFLYEQIAWVYESLVTPATSRLIQTVAENRQPYFTEWASSFGPNIYGFPIFFWLFFVGSVFLFHRMLKSFEKKDRFVLSGGYLIFLSAIIFSRYSQSAMLNGENAISLLIYFSGIVGFGILLLVYYFKYYNLSEHEKLKNIDFGLIMIFVFFVLSIISARGAVRLIMMLVAPSSAIVAYFIVELTSEGVKRNSSKRKDIGMIAVSIIVIIATLFAGYAFYQNSTSVAEGYVPSLYTQQWQKAMGWVRDSTPQDSVFGHWWDYGYWVQSIGNRATVLDGGNSISYWNHLMGRYALTGNNESEALEFLYAHNTTHFLIDSTDLGKYTAYSSIGSDENYDRRSWASIGTKDSSQTIERKNSTTYVYPMGIVLDGDVFYEQNGERIFLPGLDDANMEISQNNLAALGGILVEKNMNSDKILGVQGIYYYLGKQYQIPLRYAFYKGQLVDFGEGIDAGVFIFPRLVQNGNQIGSDESGAMVYLSSKIVHSQFARLYLYGEEGNFELVHKQDDFVIEQIRANGLDVGEFVYYQGFRGPIKIWKINYPEGIEYHPEFIETTYPESIKKA